MAKTVCLKRYWDRKFKQWRKCMKKKGHWTGCGNG